MVAPILWVFALWWSSVDGFVVNVLSTISLTSSSDEHSRHRCHRHDTSSTRIFARKRKAKPAQKSSAYPVKKTTKSSRPTSITLSKIEVADDCLIHVAQVSANDEAFWNTADNPYGARTWPPSLGIARYLWNSDYLTHGHTERVFEIGCGTGLVSQTTARKGIPTIATDISPIALDLTRTGWKSTSVSALFKNGQSNLQTQIYDIQQPLPEESFQSKTLLVATCVLYEGPLAEAMAERIAQAFKQNLWIIVGDDDTGYREDGRAKFEDLLKEKSGIAPKWKHGTVECASLGWRAKPFSYFELNAPAASDALSSDDVNVKSPLAREAGASHASN